MSKSKMNLALFSSIAFGSVALLTSCTTTNLQASNENKELNQRITDTQIVTNKLDGIVELPSSKKILDKDWINPPTKYTMPKNCVTDDKNSIARGELFFNNLSGATAKGLDAHAKNIGTSLTKPNGKNKPFGNCIACHNIENGVGGGNVGPDLRNYKQYFVDSGVRDAQWIYQKIADPRVDNPNSIMTINLTTSRLFNEQEICDIVSYLLKK